MPILRRDSDISTARNQVNRLGHAKLFLGDGKVQGELVGSGVILEHCS